MTKVKWRAKRGITRLASGRQPYEASVMGVASFSLTPRHVAWLTKTARGLNVSRSFIVQLALERLMGAAKESENGEAPG